MKVVYISSPYSIGDQAANVRRQIVAAHVVMDLGHAPVAPLLTHYLHIHRPRPYEEWMAVDLKLVEKADVVWRLPGDSRGADREVSRARERGIRVVSSTFELVEALGLALESGQYPATP